MCKENRNYFTDMLIKLIEMDLIVILLFIIVGLLAYIAWQVTPNKRKKQWLFYLYTKQILAIREKDFGSNKVVM